MTASINNPKASNEGMPGRYARVNGLDLYYEIYGTGQPLVLIHGAFSAIGTSFGQVLPALAKSRQVIAVDLQGHGHTADIDRPLTLENLADDVASLLKHLKIEKADLFGYSVGSGVALYLTLRHPEMVRKLVMVSITFNNAGFHPGLIEGMAHLKPEYLVGTPWHDEYASIAPNPEAFPALVEKVKYMNLHLADLPAEAIRSIKAPTFLIIGDSDIMRPEHTVEMFRLLGGGVEGDSQGLPDARLAILPATTHSSIMSRADWLVSMVSEFLDAPMPQAEG